MRGLRLFIRPIEPADESAVRAFLALHGGPRTAPEPAVATGLLGKLLGNLTAVVRTSDGGDALRVEEIVVARELRRKRIGRAMLRDASELAARLGYRKLVVDDPGGAVEFFRRVGFEREGDRWVLTIPETSGAR